MKKLTIALLILVCSLCAEAQNQTLKVDPLTEIVNETRADAAGWVEFSLEKHMLYLYKPDKIVRVSADIREIWTKWSYLDKTSIGKEIENRKRLNLSVEGYDKLSFTLDAVRINCRSREFALLEALDYNVSGEMLFDTGKLRFQMKKIVPESLMDSLSEKVCASE